MSMLKIAERVMGEGALYRDGQLIMRAAYELSRYGEFHVRDGHLVQTGEVVEGHLHASPDTLEPLLGTASPLTVHLDDGRRCDVYLLNSEGTLTSADGRGFYA